MFGAQGTALVIEIIIGIATIVAFAAGSIKWLVKHYLSELKPNSGSSMRDEIKQIKQRQDEADIMRRDMDKKLDKMYIILLDYISKQSK
jgi:hypothetical protein